MAPLPPSPPKTMTLLFTTMAAWLYLPPLIDYHYHFLLFLYQFHAQKAPFKVPKICNIIFWIENDPPKNSSDLVAGPFPEEKEREEDDKKNYKICYSRNLYIFTIDRKNWLRCEKKKGGLPKTNKTINSEKQLVQEWEKQSKGKYKQAKKITKTNKQTNKT